MDKKSKEVFLPTAKTVNLFLRRSVRRSKFTDCVEAFAEVNLLTDCIKPHKRGNNLVTGII